MKEIAVELAKRPLSEIARVEKSQHVDLAAKPQSDQEYADPWQKAGAVHQQREAGDRRKPEHRGDIGRENSVDEVAGGQPANQRRQPEQPERRCRRRRREAAIS
jgi:formate dehydrogenase assembly factor FdhD